MESPAKTAASSARAGPTEISINDRSLGPPLAIAAGFVLALAATLAGPVATPGGESVARRVTVALPEWLVVASCASVLLAGAIGIVTVFPRSRRRRKRGEDEYEMYQEPRRLPPLLGIVLIGIALSPAAALTGLLFWFGHESAWPPERGSIVIQHLPFTPPLATAAPPQGTTPKPASPVTTGLVGAVTALAALGSLAFVAWLGFGDRWLRRDPFTERYRARVAQAVDESLEDLASEPDMRLAVQKIYRNFERVLTAADMPKRAWQTPSEFMWTALTKRPVLREPAGELTRLFEIARFSAHSVGPDERERAWRSLEAIRTSIGTVRGGPNGRIS